MKPYLSQQMSWSANLMRSGGPVLDGWNPDAPRARLVTLAAFVGLARDPDARVALAVIPLLLIHPECAEAILQVAMHLEGDARLTFECYCTAAYWLQRRYNKPLADLLASQSPCPIGSRQSSD